MRKSENIKGVSNKEEEHQTRYSQLNHRYKQNLRLHVLFIDFKQAYDFILRSKLYESVGNLGVPQNPIQLIKQNLE